MCTRASRPSRYRVRQGAGGWRERQVICYRGSAAEFWSLGPPEAARSHLSFVLHVPVQGLENKCLLVGDSISGLGEGGLPLGGLGASPLPPDRPWGRSLPGEAPPQPLPCQRAHRRGPVMTRQGALLQGGTEPSQGSQCGWRGWGRGGMGGQGRWAPGPASSTPLGEWVRGPPARRCWGQASAREQSVVQRAGSEVPRGACGCRWHRSG